jgi:hypothetical protein
MLLSYSGLWAKTYLAYAKQPIAMVDSNHAPIKHIEKGDALYVLSDKHYHGQLRVVHVKTHSEGFIPAHEVLIEKEISFMELMSGNFTHSEVQNPELVIRNSTHADMMIKIGEHEYALKPHEIKSIHLSKGKYYYRVIIPEIEHYYGIEVLDEYKRYDWDFYVEEEKLTDFSQFSRKETAERGRGHSLLSLFSFSR